LMEPGVKSDKLSEIENSWKNFSQTSSIIINYKQSHRFAHLHLDLIDGNYAPMSMGNGEPIDYFEIEIGNQICYSAPMYEAGAYFRSLQDKWLPYYNKELRLQRLQMIKEACIYDLDHIPFFIKRELYFQSFDILYKAFQEYLQALFVANGTYPIAYNKWIKEQVVNWLQMPDLYKALLPILSIPDIESNQIIDKAGDLRRLLDQLT
jgi:hypothetical protein